METSIGIKQQNHEHVANRLSQVLADEFALYVKTMRAYWNVLGKTLDDKRLLFELHHKEQALIVDSVAERIRYLDYYPPSSLPEFSGLPHLTVETSGTDSDQDILKELVGMHDAAILSLRDHVLAIKEDYHKDTENYIVGLIKTHGKMAWQLRAHLV